MNNLEHVEHEYSSCECSPTSPAAMRLMTDCCNLRIGCGPVLELAIFQTDNGMKLRDEVVGCEHERGHQVGGTTSVSKTRLSRNVGAEFGRCSQSLIFRNEKLD